MLQASRSHLDKGVYDIYFPAFSDDERLALLADMADCSPDAGSVCCWDGDSPPPPLLAHSTAHPVSNRTTRHAHDTTRRDTQGS